MKRDGRSLHPLYSRWHNWMGWCYNENHPKYHAYGGKGIGIARKWHDFWQFAEWVESNLGHMPFAGAVMDRIDNGKMYKPGNIRWTTMRNNCWDKSDSHMIKIGKQRMCLAAWSHATGVKSETAWCRWHDRNWTWSQAFEFEPGPYQRRRAA